jgi:hypothetical protein
MLKAFCTVRSTSSLPKGLTSNWLRVLQMLLTSYIILSNSLLQGTSPLSHMRPLPDEHHGTAACNATDSCSTLRTGVHGIYLAAPRDAQARTTGQPGLLPRLASHPVGALHGEAVAGPARAGSLRWAPGAACHDGLQSLGHMGRCGGAGAGVCGQWTACGDRETPRPQRAAWRREQYRGQKRGDGLGFSGENPPQGEQGMASLDHPGDGCAPVPVAPGQATDLGRWPAGLPALTQAAPAGGGPAAGRRASGMAAWRRRPIGRASSTRACAPISPRFRAPACALSAGARGGGNAARQR